MYYSYQKWLEDGPIGDIHEVLRKNILKGAGKKESPSLAIIDSQSSKTTCSGSDVRGVDGGKNLKGKKRHIVVDSMGLLLVVIVHAANTHDSKAAFKEIDALKYPLP